MPFLLIPIRDEGLYDIYNTQFHPVEFVDQNVTTSKILHSVLNRNSLFYSRENNYSRKPFSGSLMYTEDYTFMIISALNTAAKRHYLKEYNTLPSSPIRMSKTQHLQKATTVMPITEITDKPTVNISSLENNFFHIISQPMAIVRAWDLKIISINPAMERELGYTKEELLHNDSKVIFNTTNPSSVFVNSIHFFLPNTSTKELLCSCTREKDHILMVNIALNIQPPQDITNETNNFSAKNKSGLDEPMNVEQEPLLWPHFRILIVDDNLMQQKVMNMILRKLGFEPDIVENGQKAVELLESKSYDIIFMDICMPVMNGWQATKEIKRKRGIDNSPFIIAATSNTEPDDQQRCWDAGMDSFIPKPVKFEQVKSALHMANRRLSGEDINKRRRSSVPF